MKKHIRNSVKAIIIKDGKILIIRKKDKVGWYAVLPGGGQQKGETLVKALKRECLEEIGAKVKPGKLLFVREYLSDNHEFAYQGKHIHQVEFFFECKLPSDYIPNQGDGPDSGQEEVRWVKFGKAEDLNLYPKTILPLLKDLDQFPRETYLGDCN